jgi:hypothetical protein
MYTLTVCLLGERSEPGRSEPVPVAVWLEDERVGSIEEYSSQVRVGLVRQNLADGTATAGLMFTKH